MAQPRAEGSRMTAADPSAASSVSHGVFDALHASVIDNPGVPAFRPSF